MLINKLVKYRKEKASTIKEEMYYSTYNLLLNILISMFEYKNLPDNCSKEQIETYMSFGACVIDEQGKAYKAEKKGIVKDNWEYNEVIGNNLVTANVRSDLINGKNCVVGYNNSLKSPNYDLFTFTDLLTETKISMKFNLIYARANSFFKARNQSEKVKLEKAIQNCIDGKIDTIVSDDTIDLIAGDGRNGFERVPITDIKDIDKIQYLSQFYNDILKNFANIYGQSFNTSQKLAQQSVEEIQGMDCFSFIIPVDMLNCRKKWVSELNDLFGWDIEVDFSPAWKIKLMKFDENNNGELEELAAEEEEIEEIEENVESEDVENESDV